MFEVQDSSWKFKEEVAETAISLFKRGGYNNVTVNDICKACGISRSVFYSSFNGIIFGDLVNFYTDSSLRSVSSGQRSGNVARFIPDRGGKQWNNAVADLSRKLHRERIITFGLLDLQICLPLLREVQVSGQPAGRCGSG